MENRYIFVWGVRFSILQSSPRILKKNASPFSCYRYQDEGKSTGKEAQIIIIWLCVYLKRGGECWDGYVTMYV
jgi:hypothetical protein